MEEMIKLSNQMEEQLTLPDDEEAEVVIIIKEILAKDTVDWKLTMLSRICVSRVVLQWEYINFIRANWRLTRSIMVSPYKHRKYKNVFILKCKNESDFYKIKEFKPWFFKGDLVVMAEIPDTGIPADGSLDLEHEMIWLKAMEVPIAYTSEEALKKVVKNAGIYQKHVILVGSNLLEKDVMIQVKVEVKKKVKYSMVAANEEGEKTVINFEYECLPQNLSTKCNIMDHPELHCEGSRQWLSPAYQKKLDGGEGSYSKANEGEDVGSISVEKEKQNSSLQKGEDGLLLGREMNTEKTYEPKVQI
ncbi:uncharacterized protein LOC113317848 [Papaver somniferum]|uniref:uncharacterized protein LOC113317848 n=1 Tax=Papaver somniferum TaxID=3469 RepID=UPI000E6FF5FF|nr:uncharacterized protein LOC113317848 [Papaver somniferum]